jgi:hypothetical protein
MDTAFVIGNGESRNIFPIEHLKGKGIVYGCNAIYRDHPTLCDHVVAVNPPMYEELKKWHDTEKKPKEIYHNHLIAGFKKRSLMLDKAWEGKNPQDKIEFRSPKQKILDLKNTRILRNKDEKPDIQIHGIDDISPWDYICEGDTEDEVPTGLKIYRMWRGGDVKKGNGIRTMDFSKSRGSGMSAVLLAAESGIKNIIVMSFDILGARQWEMDSPSREQNNIYKNTINYPDRMSMKAYLKYEWMYQLRQIVRKHPNTNFHFINRREYIEGNTFLRWYFDQPNIKTGIYADLKRWIDGARDDIRWLKL